MEALMVHGRFTIPNRADLVRRDETIGRAIYALQTNLDQHSST
jgi:hypothetical protein